jgi:glycosyltransferase 2 family protein
MSSVAESSSGGGKAWIGYIVAAGSLVWVFHDVRWSNLFAGVKAMTWWLLVPAIAADIGSYVIQGTRWGLLLRPLGHLSILKATQAIYAALFTNEVLPLRMGEVLRGYLATRWTSLSMTRIFSSILVERFLDGVWMVLAFGVVVLALPLPRYLVDAEVILAFVIFAAAALFIYLVIRKERQIEEEGARLEAAVPTSFGGRLSHLIELVAAALRSIGGAPSFYGAAALSGLLLVLQVLSFWLVMEAYGMSLSLWHGAAVFLIVHLGTIVPSAPSNLGTYQFFTVLGLMLFDVDKTVASGFSLVVFLILTIPLWIVGLVAFGRAGLDLQTVREEAANLGKQWRIPPAAILRSEPERGTGGDDDSVGA